MDVFSILSAEPAVSDNATPKTATAAADSVTFLAWETSHGLSRRGSSLRSASAAGAESGSTGSAVAMATVSVSAVITLFGSDIRQGRSAGRAAPASS